MGIFRDIKAMKDLQKIKKGGTAKLSISQVTGLITNMMDARKNLSVEQFNCIYKLFNELRKCNTKIEMDKNEYYETAVDIIKRFDKISPYIKYSGGNEMEFLFIMEDIYKHDNTLNEELFELKEEDIQYVNNLIASSNGIIERAEAEEFIQVIYTYSTLGKEKCLKSFDSLAIKLIHNKPVMAIMKLSLLNGALNANGVIDEFEMKENCDYYKKIIMDIMSKENGKKD